MRILLIYHFFYPDSVISARLFSELGEELVTAGHEVTVYTSNRCIRQQGILSEHEQWQGVGIRRFARPDFRQGSHVGRVLNSLILQRKWLKALKHEPKTFEAVIVGTDPQFCWLMFPALKRIMPKARLIHWVFDLYPEALAATGSRLMGLAARVLRPLARRAYRQVDVMADIGECMRRRLESYGGGWESVTATPWALAEAVGVAPVDQEMRRELFGESRLCLLYSGTVGQAHDLEPFIRLARECRQRGLSVGFCFAGYGNRYAAQTGLITAEDTNIRLAGFASEEELGRRLSAADFHLISLRPGWEGVVVPSKFFGALAMGRPVLYAGPSESEIAGWIQAYGIGEVVGEGILESIERFLVDEELMETLRQRAWETYQRCFSRRCVVGRLIIESPQKTRNKTKKKESTKDTK